MCHGKTKSIFSDHHNEDTDKLLCCQTADLTVDLNLYFVLKGHVPASLFALADHIDTFFIVNTESVIVSHKVQSCVTTKLFLMNFTFCTVKLRQRH